MEAQQINDLIKNSIGLIGVVIGASITAFVNLRLKTKEVRLRMLEKIFDKRLAAHEQILEIAKYLRTTISTNEIDLDSNAITYTAFLSDSKMFENLKGKFYELVNFNTHWLDIEVFRELNFIQDYIGNVGIRIKNIPDENLPEIGKILKDDFVDLSSSLEKITIKFFDKDIYKMKIETGNRYHKYKREVTIGRLNQTNLVKRWQEIERYKIIENKE